MNVDRGRMVALMGLLVSACSSTSSGLDPGQEILFHFSCENFAWGREPTQVRGTA